MSNAIWKVGARVRDKISGLEGVITIVLGDWLVVRYDDRIEVQLPRTRFVIIDNNNEAGV